MSEIYQLKIIAIEIKPPIERIVWIKSTATFFSLHNTIQRLFGLHAYHLFEFYAHRDAAPIGDGYEDRSRLAKNVKLSTEFRYVKKMKYVYDFGDQWEFSITLQKILPDNKLVDYPFCIDGMGGMLIEDCGGPHCYNSLAAWCKNKIKVNKDALLEHYDEEMIKQYEDFELQEFNLEEVNRLISKKKK